MGRSHWPRKNELDPGLDDAVSSEDVQDGSLQAADLDLFQTTSAGTGASQDIAHGLGRVPSLVLVVPTSGHDGAGGTGTQAATVAYGAHDATHVRVTVTQGATYKVVAL